MTTSSKILFGFFSLASVVCSCTRSGFDAIEPDGRFLAVGNVVLVTSGDWSSKSSDRSVAEPVAIDLGDGLSLSAEEGWIGDLTHADLNDSTMAEQHVAFVTKGTPITSASQINAFQINLFNSGSSVWNTSTPLTESITATKNDRSYGLSNVFDWTSETDNISLLAYAPVPATQNGLTANANGRNVQYVVPTDVAQQPDFCTASEFNQINTTGIENVRNFGLNHRLTAVKVAIHGGDVKVTKVEIAGVACSATFDLNTNKWTTETADQSRTMGVNETQIYTDSYGNGSKNWTDATNADGSMMMIPQKLTADAKLEVTYQGVNGNTESGKITANINGLTGGVWKPGAKVTYNIQLKMAANTSGTTLTMPWKAGYTTTEPVAFLGTHDPADRYTFTWNDTWQKTHHGAARVNDVSGGQIAPWYIDATAIKNKIWFFATTDNPSTSSIRNSTVVISGRRTAPRTITVSQDFKPSITTNPATFAEAIPSGGKSYTTQVVCNYPWKATSTTGGVTFSPASGTATEGENVVVTVPANTGGGGREVVVKFETTNDGGNAGLITNATWKGSQSFPFSIDLTGPGELVVGAGKEYTVNVTTNAAWSVVGTGITATPASGTGNGVVKLLVGVNPSDTEQRAVRADFKVGSTVVASWLGTQLLNPKSIVLDSSAPEGLVLAMGQEYTINVTSKLDWTAVGSGVTVVPAKGGVGTTAVRLIVQQNPTRNATTNRTVKVDFKNSGGIVDATWSGTQEFLFLKVEAKKFASTATSGTFTVTGSPGLSVQLSLGYSDWGFIKSMNPRAFTLTGGGAQQIALTMNEENTSPLDFTENLDCRATTPGLSWLDITNFELTHRGPLNLRAPGYITEEGDGTGLPAGLLCVSNFGASVGLYVDKRASGGDPKMVFSTDGSIPSGLDDEMNGGYSNAGLLADPKYVAANYCRARGLFLPAKKEIEMIIQSTSNSQPSYALELSTGSWTSTSVWGSVVYAGYLFYGSMFFEQVYDPAEERFVRCVGQY